MSWLVFLGNLAKIFFLDSHAMIIPVRTYLDVFLPCNMARSWQYFPCFIMFLVMAIKFRFTGKHQFLSFDQPINHNCVIIIQKISF